MDAVDRRLQKEAHLERVSATNTATNTNTESTPKMPRSDPHGATPNRTTGATGMDTSAPPGSTGMETSNSTGAAGMEMSNPAGAKGPTGMEMRASGSASDAVVAKRSAGTAGAGPSKSDAQPRDPLDQLALIPGVTVYRPDPNLFLSNAQRSVCHCNFSPHLVI